MAAGTIEEILDQALFMAQHLYGCDLRSMTIAVLFDLEIPTQKTGFEYLKIAIMLFAENPSRMFSDGIYQVVGEQYDIGLTNKQIEQAIRSVIRDAWRNRNAEKWCRYFPGSRIGGTKPPSNGEFITRIGYFLELCQGCCREVSYEK